MWQNHDDNLGERHGKNRDHDVDININNLNITIDQDGDTHFGHGGFAGRHSGLNLCDVARGISEVFASRGGASGVDDAVLLGKIADADTADRDAFHGGARSAAKEFGELRNRDEDPPYIDCDLGRMVEGNHKAIVVMPGKMGGRLKDSEG